MPNESNRREFIRHLLRIGGLFTAFGDWIAYSLVTGQGNQPNAAVPSRISISNSDDIIHQFLSARGPHALYLFQTSFPVFLEGTESTVIGNLQSACERQMKSADTDIRARLRALPAMVAAHALPLAQKEDSSFLRKIISDTNQSALGEHDPSRPVLAVLWTSLTAAVIRSETSWQNLIVGPAIIREARDVCLHFLRGEELLVNTAMLAWQFLLTYSRALAPRRDWQATEELKSVSLAINEIEREKSSHYVWLGKLSELYLGRNEHAQMLPEFFELIIGRGKTEKGSPERETADFFVQARLRTVYNYNLIADGKINSNFACDAESARKKAVRSFSFLVDFGLTRKEWNEIKSKRSCILDRDCINFIDAGSKEFESTSQINPKEIEWFVKKVPFRYVLPEENAAVQAYSEPGVFEKACEALQSISQPTAQTALILPGLMLGIDSACSNSIAKTDRDVIVDRVSEAAETVLKNPPYETAFKSLSARIGESIKEYFSRGTPAESDRFLVSLDQAKSTLTKAPARLIVAGEGEVQSPEAKERSYMDQPTTSETDRSEPIKQDIALSPVTAGATMFNAPCIKVRLPNIGMAERVFELLFESGYEVDAFSDLTFGLNSDQQLELLKKNGITYERIK